MPRPTLPQSRRHVMIYDEDWEYLCAVYDRSGPNPVGVSTSIREIVHRFVSRVKAGAQQTLAASPSGGTES